VELWLGLVLVRVRVFNPRQHLHFNPLYDPHVRILPNSLHVSYSLLFICLVGLCWILFTSAADIEMMNYINKTNNKTPRNMLTAHLPHFQVNLLCCRLRRRRCVTLATVVTMATVTHGNWTSALYVCVIAELRSVWWTAAHRYCVVTLCSFPPCAVQSAQVSSSGG